MRLFYLILGLAMIGSQNAGGEVSRNVKIFWIPPEIETYVPVTADNIEQTAFKIVQIRNEKQATSLLGLIQKSDQVITPKRIRVKISTDGKFYNFDSNGIGLSSSGEAVKIDLKSLKIVLCE